MILICDGLNILSYCEMQKILLRGKHNEYKTYFFKFITR